MKLTILATSDIHGYGLPNNGLSTEMQPYGLSRVFHYLRKKKATEENIVLVENGDLLQGAPLTTYLGTHMEEWGVHPFVELLNEIAYDVAIPGNHEFNYGLPYLEKTVAAMNFPYLAANVVNEAGEPHWKAYEIIEKSDVKVGIIGLTTNHIPRWEQAENISGLSFLDPVETAIDWARKIRKDVDILLIAYHGGLERDIETGAPTEYLTGENVGYQLAIEVPELDGLITGHQHKVAAGKINGIPVFQPGTKGAYLGEMIFELEKQAKGWKILASEAKIIELANEPEDAFAKKTLKKWEQQKNQWLDQPLQPDGTTVQRFLHQIQQLATQVSLSANSLYLTEPEKQPANSITMRQIFANYPFPNTYAVLRMKGKDLFESVLKATEYYGVHQEERLSSFPKTMLLDDIFDLFAGIDYQLKLNEAGAYDLENLSIQGESVQLDKSYELVLNHYRPVAGMKKRIYGEEKIIQELMIFIPDIVAIYQARGRVNIPSMPNYFLPYKN